MSGVNEPSDSEGKYSPKGWNGASTPSANTYRLAYYTSGLYYSQMREGGSYGELTQAISVCFLNEPSFPAVAAGHLSFSLWAFFFANAHRFDGDQLRRLLPEPVYQKATEILEMIAREPELRLIYDDRAKEEKDKFSFVKDALRRRRKSGRGQGL